MPRSSEMSTVAAGDSSVSLSIDSVSSVRYGWAPQPYGHAEAPVLVAMVVTRRPSADRRYSTSTVSENG